MPPTVLQPAGFGEPLSTGGVRLAGARGWGWGWRGWGGAGWQTATVSNIPIGTLIVDLVDPSEKRLVWRGVATEYVDKILKMDPEEKTKAANEAMAKLFKEYPPRA